MSHMLERWAGEHRNFGRLLDALGSQLAVLRTDSEPDYALMLDIMDYLTSYSDRVHHPMEDRIFARVAARRPALRPAVAALHEEHRHMGAAGEALRSRVQNVLNGMIDSRIELARAGEDYIAAFRMHMERENRELFPAAGEALQPTDWAHVAAQAGETEADPLAEDRLDQQYAALRRAISAG